MNSTGSALAPKYKYIEVKNETLTHIAGYFVRLVLAICKEVEPLYTDPDTTPANIADVAFEAFSAAYMSTPPAPLTDRDREMAVIVQKYLRLLGVARGEPGGNDWSNEDTTRSQCEIEFLWPAFNAYLEEKFNYTPPTLPRIVIDVCDFTRPWCSATIRMRTARQSG